MSEKCVSTLPDDFVYQSSAVSRPISRRRTLNVSESDQRDQSRSLAKGKGQARRRSWQVGLLKVLVANRCLIRSRKHTVLCTDGTTTCAAAVRRAMNRDCNWAGADRVWRASWRAGMQAVTRACGGATTLQARPTGEAARSSPQSPSIPRAPVPALGRGSGAGSRAVGRTSQRF